MMQLKVSLKQHSMVLAIPVHVHPPLLELKLAHHSFCSCSTSKIHITSSAKDSTNPKLPFKIPLRWPNTRWKFSDFDTGLSFFFWPLISIKFGFLLNFAFNHDQDL